MSLKPYIVPATSEVQYPDVRVSAFSLTQQRAGAPLVISYEFVRCRTVNGVVEDAPNRGGGGSSNTQIGLAAVGADPDLPQAIATIHARVIAHAVAAGLLEQQ
jgi:hypothetical protein